MKVDCLRSALDKSAPDRSAPEKSTPDGFRAGESRTRQAREDEIASGDVGARKIGALQGRRVETDVHEAHRLIPHVRPAAEILENGALEPRVIQVPDKTGTGQIGTAQVGAGQLHREHLRPTQVRLPEIGPLAETDSQVATGEDGAAQVRAIEYRGASDWRP